MVDAKLPRQRVQTKRRSQSTIALIRAYDMVFISLDALDECPEDDDDTRKERDALARTEMKGGGSAVACIG